MEKYLIEDLGVPRDHIQHHLGPREDTTTSDSTSSTHASIIRILYSLIDNPDIMHRYNTIIYFARNGICCDA